MRIDVTTFDITTLVVLTGGCFVMVVNAQQKLESNVPPLFFAGLIAYLFLHPGRIPALAVYAGALCALLLRFEFMDHSLTRFLHYLQYFIVGTILYTGVRSLLSN